MIYGIFYCRQLLKYLDEDLGEPIPEKDYGGNCRMYDWEKPDDPFHNINEKFDVFIFAHSFGYFCKTLIFRDWWFTTVISVMFEFLEYSLEHQLPNFSECWWDHWILDVLICNGGGTILGLMTLRYLSIKTYNWRGLWNIPTYRGKIKRIIAQFRLLSRSYKIMKMSLLLKVVAIKIYLSLSVQKERNLKRANDKS